MARREYLEETWPRNPLLPTDAAGRARVRSIAQYVVSEIQPLQNTRLVPHLQEKVCSLERLVWRPASSQSGGKNRAWEAHPGTIDSAS